MQRLKRSHLQFPTRQVAWPIRSLLGGAGIRQFRRVSAHYFPLHRSFFVIDLHHVSCVLVYSHCFFCFGLNDHTCQGHIAMLLVFVLLLLLFATAGSFCAKHIEIKFENKDGDTKTHLVTVSVSVRGFRDLTLDLTSRRETVVDTPKC